MSVCNESTSVRRSLESVLSQEGSDFEVIVVDDGSTDGTRDVLEEYARRYPNVRVASQPNCGLTKALMVGCDIATGTFIARQDAGDISLPGRLRIQREALEASPGMAFVSCWTEFVGPQSEMLFVKRGSGVARTATSILDDNQRWGVIDGPTHHGSVMFRKSAYLCAKGYRDAFYFGQDWDLWYRLAAIGQFQVIDRVLYRVTVGLGGISSRYARKQRAAAEVSRAALRLRMRGMFDDELLEMARRIGPESAVGSGKCMARDLYFVGQCLRRRGDARAWQYFKRCIGHDRFAWRAWLRLAQMVVLGERSD